MGDDKICIVSVSAMGESFAQLSLKDITINSLSPEQKLFSESFDVFIIIQNGQAKFIRNVFGEKLPTIYLDNVGGYLKNELYRL